VVDGEQVVAEVVAGNERRSEGRVGVAGEDEVVVPGARVVVDLGNEFFGEVEDEEFVVVVGPLVRTGPEARCGVAAVGGRGRELDYSFHGRGCATGKRGWEFPHGYLQTLMNP